MCSSELEDNANKIKQHIWKIEFFTKVILPLKSAMLQLNTLVIISMKVWVDWVHSFSNNVFLTTSVDNYRSATYRHAYNGGHVQWQLIFNSVIPMPKCNDCRKRIRQSNDDDNTARQKPPIKFIISKYFYLCLNLTCLLNWADCNVTIYVNHSARMCCSAADSQRIPNTDGVLFCGILKPTLFCIFVDELIVAKVSSLGRRLSHWPEFFQCIGICWKQYFNNPLQVCSEFSA